MRKHENQQNNKAAHHNRPQRGTKPFFTIHLRTIQTEVEYVSDLADQRTARTNAGAVHFAATGQSDDDWSEHTQKSENGSASNEKIWFIIRDSSP